MKENYYRNFLLYNRDITDEEVRSYTSPCEGILLVVLKDGTRLTYYENDNYTRIMPRDDKNLSEEECMYEFGDRLRMIMMCEGVNQLELSERTGISQSAISSYLNGRACPSFYKVDKIAKALGCSIDDLSYRT